MTTDYEFIVYERNAGVVTIILNDPRRLNALSWQMQSELRDAITNIEKDDSARVVVFTGAGDRSFCVGADIALFKDMSSTKGYELMRSGYDIHRQLERIEKPLVAMVNGFCMAGGLELALACDFIIASENAVFSAPEVNLGIIPGWGGTVRLPRAIPSRMAKELIFTGDRISAQQARDLGLVNRVVPLAELKETVNVIVEKMLGKAPLAVRLAKVSINNGLETSDIDSALVMERGLISTLYGTDDCREGISAFLEKREPEFKGK